MADASSFNWVVQIGPTVSGSANGVINGTSGSFYLSLGTGDPSQTYAWYSTTAGSQWVAIPNNQAVTASGSNSVQYKYNAPSGVSFKFLIGPPS
jgi:hypothetical protein